MFVTYLDAVYNINKDLYHPDMLCVCVFSVCTQKENIHICTYVYVCHHKYTQSRNVNDLKTVRALGCISTF